MQKDDAEAPAQAVSATAFTKAGRTYNIGDFLFLNSQAVDQLPGAVDARDNVPEYAAKEGRWGLNTCAAAGCMIARVLQGVQHSFQV